MADFYVCPECRLYFPTGHPASKAFNNVHAYCTLPPYTSYDERLHTFEERGGPQVLSRDDIPDDCTCTLNSLELLAYACTVSEPEPVPAPTHAHAGHYVLCRSCAAYFPMAHPGAINWRVRHVLCSTKGMGNKPENIGISYANVYPDYYTCELSPLEQLACSQQDRA